MKRLATLIVSAAFILCTAGCSDNSVSGSNPPSSSSSEQTNETTATPSQEDYEEEDYYTESDGYTNTNTYTETDTIEETEYESDSSVYYEVDDRERKKILANPNDYETGDSEARYTSIQLNDIVYHGLGDYFGNIMNYSGRTRTPDYIGFGNHGMNGTYYTYFENMDMNRHLLFSTDNKEYFNAEDYCYGASGWFERVFDYDKTQGLCEVRDLMDILDADESYVVYSWSEEYYVPSNLDSDVLYAVEADLDTASGVRSCVILLEASSESSYITGDSWVEVLVQ